MSALTQLADLDPLRGRSENEVAADAARLHEAANYLTLALRRGKTVPVDFRKAVAEERNALEWEAWSLELALAEHRAHVDAIGLLTDTLHPEG